LGSFAEWSAAGRYCGIALCLDFILAVDDLIEMGTGRREELVGLDVPDIDISPT
jgi:hypothetical protein